MTINDDMPINLAKALNSESFSVPSFNIVATTEVTSIDLAATDLDGVIGTADPFTNSRVTNITTFEAIRSGTSVVDTANGDELKSAGTTTLATGGTLQSGVVIDELQTTAFDIEFIWNYTVDRA